MTKKNIRDLLLSEPVFVITSDLDWASEYCIEKLFSKFEESSIKPTFFVTHKSEIISKLLCESSIECGIHPNFLPNTTHGSSENLIINHVLELVPHANVTRSHAYASSTHISRALVKSGIKCESGPVYLFQQNLMPLKNIGGLVNFPVFWEDDCHWDACLTWNFNDYHNEFLKPGLKVINIHPFFYTLNIPSSDFYNDHKHFIQNLTKREAKKFRYNGDGCATFTDKLIKLISNYPDNIFTINDIYVDLYSGGK